MPRGPLAGVRIADFTWIGAGSFTTKLLADFGADVIKIETATRMDTLRTTPPFKSKGEPATPNLSGYFSDRNTSKRSIRLNLKHPEALALAEKIIAQSDIVTNNFTPGIMDKLGLGYARVSQINPGIIYLSMSMQGQTGPDANFVGFGLTIAALSGLSALTGPADRPPSTTGTNYPDHVPNPCHGAFAVLAALRHKRRTGIGQFIDFAQTEPTIALSATAIADWSANRHDTKRSGNDIPGAAPHGVYPCAGTDRWIAIGVHNDAQWQGLLSVLGAPLADLAPANTESAEQRLANRPALDAWLSALTPDWQAEDLMGRLRAAGVPAGVVQNIADLVDHDPQLAHRAHWVTLDHAEMGRTLYNAPPIHLSLTPSALSRPAPLLGEHTREICAELLDMSDDEFTRLQTAGVFE